MAALTDVPASELKEDARWLGAGMLMTLSTGFGQTFFISVYAGEWREEFGLSHGTWGAIYMVATLASAAALTQAGRLADLMRARSLALLVLGLFAMVCVGVSQASSWLMLAALVFGLRFCGQGMLSHIAITAMGKWFRARRARAVAIASLGFSGAEAALPAAALAITAAVGWRASWLVAAAMLILFVAPALALLLRRERAPKAMASTYVSPGMGGLHWTPGEMVRHWVFWALLPGLIGPGWIGTVVFFQVVHMTELKGWDVIAYTGVAYPAFSVVTIASSFLFGWAADRFGAVRLLPVYLLGWVAGVTLIGLSDSLATGVVALAVCGLGSGAVYVVGAALVADLYGTRRLGGVRGLTTALMVVASALGPGVSGALLDAGVGFEIQCFAMAAYLAAVSLWFAWVSRRARGLLAAAA